MSLPVEHTAPTLRPLPRSVSDLTSLDEVLERSARTTLSVGADELFDLDDRLLKLEDDFALVFRYEDLRQIGSTPAAANVPYRYSQKRFMFEPLGIPMDDPAFKHARSFSSNGFFTAVPKVHDTLKPIFARPLMPKGMPPLAATMQEMATELVDRLAGTGEINFLEDFAQTLAYAFWAKTLNMSDDEVSRLHQAVRKFGPITAPSKLTPEALVTLDEGVAEYQRILFPAVRRTREAGTAPFIELIARQFAAIPEPPEDMPESVDAMVSTALLDGFHAMGASLAGCVQALVTTPDAYRQVREDPSLIPNAVSEGLRLYGPVRMISRYVMEDFEYEGLQLPAGTMLALNWGAGGRDPAVFTNPRKVDLHRPSTAPQTFGAGGQICPGRSLVRTFSAAGLSALLQPGILMELTGEIRWFEGEPLTVGTYPIRLPIRIQRA